MSKKNSNVNLKNGFKDYKDLSAIFLNFQKKLDFLKKKKYLVAVSGGPDSLALVALTKAYNFCKKTKFYYFLLFFHFFFDVTCTMDMEVFHNFEFRPDMSI